MVKSKQAETAPYLTRISRPLPGMPERVDPKQVRVTQQEEITLVLPLLPSVNRKNKVGRSGVYTDKGYQQQETSLVLIAKSQINQTDWQAKPTDRYRLDITLYFENELRGDTDGPVKPLIDCLQEAGVLHNDNRMTNYNVNRVWCAEGQSKAVVTVMKVGKLTQEQLAGEEN